MGGLSWLGNQAYKNPGSKSGSSQLSWWLQTSCLLLHFVQAKLLCRKLNEVLPDMISCNQGAFITGRKMMHNVMSRPSENVQKSAKAGSLGVYTATLFSSKDPVGISTDRLLTYSITFPYTRVEKGFRVKAQDAWKILPYLRSRIIYCRESALMNKQDHKRTMASHRRMVSGNRTETTLLRQRWAVGQIVHGLESRIRA